MDPLSQGILGAAAGGVVGGRKMPRASLLLGFLTGLAADLDVYIPTGGDPTVGWIWHRGFTHALTFIPAGAAACFGLFMIIPALRRQWKTTLLICLAAYATHAPLDALTSYGTQLFWPFTDYRVALDWMPIIDPVWTLTMVALLLVAGITRKPHVAVAALVFAGLYFSFGAWQHSRAVDAVHALAERRGHTIEHYRATPSLGALSLWRGVYVSDGEVYADGIFVPYIGRTRIRTGESRHHIEAGDLLELIDDAEARRQFEVFRWFADDLLVPVEGQPTGIISDGRYSADPAGFSPLWGMDFIEDPPRRYRPTRQFRRDALLSAMFGRDERYVPLE